MIRFFHSHRVLAHYVDIHTFTFNNVPRNKKLEFSKYTNANTLSMSLKEFRKIVQKKKPISDWSKTYIKIYFYEDDPVYDDQMGEHDIHTMDLTKRLTNGESTTEEHEFAYYLTDSRAKIIMDFYSSK